MGKMINEAVQHPKKQVFLFVQNCLNNEIIVLREEEELAALARTLASLEDLVLVLIYVK